MPTASGSHWLGHAGGRTPRPSENAAEGARPQKAAEGPTDEEMPETSLEHFDPREVDALEAYVRGYENFVLVANEVDFKRP